MARIRTIKPEMAAHEGLFDLELETGLPVRFAWCMLFTVADREGRFQWRPRTLKAQILPHDDIDFSRVLDAWVTRGFIVKYRVGGEWYGCIPTFRKHQVINNRESASDLPGFESAEEAIDNRNQGSEHSSSTRQTREHDACATREVHALVEGKEGREGKGMEQTREPRVLGGSGLTSTEATRDDSADAQLWKRLKSVYPPGIYPQSDWLLAERSVRRAIDEGDTWEAWIDAACRYYAQTEARGGLGTEFVKSPKRFFADRSSVNEPFPIPKKPAEKPTATDELLANLGRTGTDDTGVIEHEPE